MNRAFLTTRLGILALALIFSTTSVFAGYEVNQQPLPDDPMGATIYELDNGLKVYLTENPEKPRFYAEIAVRAGSKNDPPTVTGLAHYMEHLLFKGTSRMGALDYEKERPILEEIEQLYEEHYQEEDPARQKEIYARINELSQKAAEYAVANEMDKLYKAMGGSGVNAHTWVEEVVYKVDLPANRLEHWALVESERFRDPIFRLFQTELEVVYEEKNRSLDNKDRIILYAVLDKLYKSHPYGVPTLGTVEHLKKPSLTRLYEFYNKYYIPNNMAIFISGDIDKEETIELIDDNFGLWEQGPEPEEQQWSEKPLRGREHVTVYYPGEEYVLLAYRTNSRASEEAEALMLMDMVLDNSVAGLINLRLNQRQRVRRAGAFPFLFNDYGAQFLWGVPKDGQTLEEVEDLLLEQLEALREGDFEDWILEAIVNDFKKQEKRNLESNSGRVSWMRDSFLAEKQWAYAVDKLDRMEKVTRDDIIRLARKYFTKGYVSGYRRDGQHEVPQAPKPELDKVEIDPSRQSDFAKMVLETPAEEITPTFVDPEKDYQVKETPEGIRYYYSKNPVNDLFVLSISIDKGFRHDNRLPVAARLLNKSGTKRFSPEEIKKEWYKLGANFSFAVGEQETNITISGLDENLEESLSLLREVLMEPSAGVEVLNELIQIILVQREDARKDPDTVSRALLLFNRHGKQSRFLNLVPAEELQLLTRDDLYDRIKELLKYERTVSYIGAKSLDEVKTLFGEKFPAEEPLEETPDYVKVDIRQPEQTEIYFLEKPLAQSKVRIEFGGEAYTEDSIPASQLYNEYFAGGMSGLVFQELREARALAYVAGARYITASRLEDQNLMVGVVETQPDKTVEAVSAFIDLLDNLPQSTDRLLSSQEALINRYRTGKIGFREVLNAVQGWEDLGLEADPRQARFQALLKSDMDTMLSFHEREIQGKPKLISIVGDSSKIDMEKLSRFGQVRKITVEDIFTF